MIAKTTALIGLAETLAKLRHSLGPIHFPVLWIDRDHQLVTKEPRYDMVPTIRFADSVVFVFASGDDGSSQLLIHLEWARLTLPPDCTRHYLLLPGEQSVELNQNWQLDEVGATELAISQLNQMLTDDSFQTRYDIVRGCVVR